MKLPGTYEMMSCLRLVLGHDFLQTLTWTKANLRSHVDSLDSSYASSQGHALVHTRQNFCTLVVHLIQATRLLILMD